MTGSLQVKNEKYYLVLNTYENGKRRQKWISTDLPQRGNKRRAEQMLRDALASYEKHVSIPRSDALFSDYIAQWLRSVRRKVDEVTYQGYETLATTHVIPYFQKTSLKLTDVKTEDLQRYFDEKAEHGRKDGKGGLSPRSLKLHRNILSQALKAAVKDGLILMNPCEYVVLPPSVRYEAGYYTAEQLQRLFDATRDDPLCLLIRITAIYGLRRSEVLGIKWDSIDYDAGRLTIRHTVVKVTETVAKDKTKNASSFRSFPLVPEACAIFDRAKAEQTENRKLFGAEYIQSDYVFTWPDGRPFSPDYVSHHFSDVLKKNGLPHIRFHELRHSCASLLLNQGFNLKDVQEWMGHADIKMTANIYGHLDVARKQQMADRLSGMLGNPTVLENC